MQPVQCSQGSAARAVQPGQCSQGSAARAVQPGQCSQGSAARAVQPGQCSQGSAARAVCVIPLSVDVSCVCCPFLCVCVCWPFVCVCGVCVGYVSTCVGYMSTCVEYVSTDNCCIFCWSCLGAGSSSAGTPSAVVGDNVDFHYGAILFTSPYTVANSLPLVYNNTDFSEMFASYCRVCTIPFLLLCDNTDMHTVHVLLFVPVAVYASAAAGVRLCRGRKYGVCQVTFAYPRPPPPKNTFS